MKINLRQRALLDRIKNQINECGLPVRSKDIADEFQIPVQAVDACLKIGRRLEEVAEGGDYWLTAELIAKWRQIAMRRGGFSMARKSFRELFNLSRTVADAVFGVVLSSDTFSSTREEEEKDYHPRRRTRLSETDSELKGRDLEQGSNAPSSGQAKSGLDRPNRPTDRREPRAKNSSNPRPENSAENLRQKRQS